MPATDRRADTSGARRIATGGTARAAAHDEDLRDALVPLTKRGCPACRSGDQDARRYVFSFFAESYGEPEVLAASQRSLGFCVRDTRVLQDAYWAKRALTWLYAGLVPEPWRRASEEADRKAAWVTRHEGPSGEQTAWLRVPAHVDGSVYLGRAAGK